MWLFSYFRTEAEALHLALSSDCLSWEPLNNNKPILGGEVLTKTLRDPFLMRDQNGTFHMFSSDGWHSSYIIHTHSEDLINWSPQEAIGVMTKIPGVRNSWAPECFYDRQEDCYRVVWSSTVSDDEQPDANDHRIWSCHTKDFITWSDSELFFDPGYNVIDASVAYHDGRYLMAFKDERGENTLDTDYKAIRVCESDKGSGPFKNISGLITPSPVEGPSLFRRNEKWMMFYDHFLEGYFGASESNDGYNWRVLGDQVKFPPEPRHGCVLEIDDSIGEKLLQKWG